MGRRRLRPARLRRRSRAGVRRSRAILRRGRALHGRPRQLRNIDAGRDAFVARRRRCHRQPRFSLREGTAVTGAFRVIAACLALSLTPLANAGDADGRPLPAESVYQIDAVLTRAGDGPVAWRSLRGVPRVVTMFYSSCRAVCPMIVESARAVQRGLPERDRARVGFVLVTMDPARDTPETL